MPITQDDRRLVNEMYNEIQADPTIVTPEQFTRFKKIHAAVNERFVAPANPEVAEFYRTSVAPVSTKIAPNLPMSQRPTRTEIRAAEPKRPKTEQEIEINRQLFSDRAADFIMKDIESRGAKKSDIEKIIDPESNPVSAAMFGIGLGGVPAIEEHAPSILKERIKRVKEKYPITTATGEFIGAAAPIGVSVKAARVASVPLAKALSDKLINSPKAYELITQFGVRPTEGLIAGSIYDLLSGKKPTAESAAMFAAFEVAVPGLQKALATNTGKEFIRQVKQLPADVVTGMGRIVEEKIAKAVDPWIAKIEKKIAPQKFIKKQVLRNIATDMAIRDIIDNGEGFKKLSEVQKNLAIQKLSGQLTRGANLVKAAKNPQRPLSQIAETERKVLGGFISKYGKDVEEDVLALAKELGIQDQVRKSIVGGEKLKESLKFKERLGRAAEGKPKIAEEKLIKNTVDKLNELGYSKQGNNILERARAIDEQLAKAEQLRKSPVGAKKLRDYLVKRDRNYIIKNLQEVLEREKKLKPTEARTKKIDEIQALIDQQYALKRKEAGYDLTSKQKRDLTGRPPEKVMPVTKEVTKVTEKPVQKVAQQEPKTKFVPTGVKGEKPQGVMNLGVQAKVPKGKIKVEPPKKEGLFAEKPKYKQVEIQEVTEGKFGGRRVKVKDITREDPIDQIVLNGIKLRDSDKIGGKLREEMKALQDKYGPGIFTKDPNAQTLDEWASAVGADEEALRQEMLRRTPKTIKAKELADKEQEYLENERRKYLQEQANFPKKDPTNVSKKPVEDDVSMVGDKLYVNGEEMFSIGTYAKSRPSIVEMPEMVELARTLQGGKFPSIREKVVRGILGDVAAGVFRPGKGIALKADIFKDPEAAAKTLAHEVGHLTDWLPDKTLKRGNILGSIASLLRYMKANLGIMSNKEIREELKALTLEWKPFDPKKNKKFTSYRYSSRELYADAMSVLFNDPVLLKAKAPKFWNGLFKYLDRKPEVKRLYEEVQDMIKVGSIKDNRGKLVREMFEEGERIFSEKQQRIVDRDKHVSERIKYELIDKNEAIIKKVKDAMKQGKMVLADENPIFLVEEMNYSASEVKSWMAKINDLLNVTNKKGLKWEDVGEVVLHDRVIGERFDLANPRGFTPKTSREQLDHLLKKLGPSKFNDLRTIVQDFRKAWKPILQKLEDSEMLSEEVMQKLKENPYYATFNVLKHYEEKFGRGITSGVFPQVGTFDLVTNPVNATIMKGQAIIKAVNRKLAAKGTVEFLKKHFPDEIQLAERRWNGRSHAPIEPRDPYKGMIAYPENGKVEAYYVDRYISDVFSYGDRSQTANLAAAMSYTNRIFKEIFVNINPGFWAFNLWRDFWRTARNLPGGNVPVVFNEYLKAVKPSFKRGFGVPDDVVREMEKGKMLITVESQWGLVPEERQIEALLRRFSLNEKTWQSKVMNPFKKLFEYVESVGYSIESLPKIAGYNYLKNQGKLSSKEVGHLLRTQIGSPDFLRKGNLYSVYNNIFLFSNAIKEGWRADIEALRSRPAEFMYKTVKYNIIPKMMVYAASTGAMGSGIKEIMDGVSEYDKANYHIIPLGLDANGKSVYLRVPQDEFGRFIGGLLWKGMTQNKSNDMASLFDYMAGQAPTLTPALTIPVDVSTYLSGRNPYDWFRGRYAINEDIFKAGGWESHKEFLKYIANQGGAGIIYRFKGNSVEKVRSELEQVLNFPVTGNIIGRFVRVSNYGNVETLKRLSDIVETQETRARREIKHRIIEHINSVENPSRVDARKLWRDMKSAGFEVKDFSNFYSNYRTYSIYRKDDPYLSAIIRANTLKQRESVIQYMLDNKVINESVARKLKRLRFKEYYQMKKELEPK